MVYQYTRDDSMLGHVSYPRSTYEVLHEGLRALLAEVCAWNERVAAETGAEPPFREEEQDLTLLVKNSGTLLEGDSLTIRVGPTTVGTTRYLRAGIELLIERKKVTLEAKKREGWPAAALSALEDSLMKLERISKELRVEPAGILDEVRHRPAPRRPVGQSTTGEEMYYDVFISHASEDKETFVRDLAGALVAAGVSVWYDEFSLRIGDSLRRSIDKGLAKCRHGVVVLSPHFFNKEWAQRELDGLTANEVGGSTKILPIWHNVDVALVRTYSPTLADKVAINSALGISRVVQELLDVVKRS